MGGFRLHDIGPENLKRLWRHAACLLSRRIPKHVVAGKLHRHISEKRHPAIGFTDTLRRFWIMPSHYHGQLLNYSEIARAFGISDATTRKYIEILEGTFMVRTLLPWHENFGKRIVKRPKLYLCDSGILHYFMSIENLAQLQSTPKISASLEGFALDCVTKSIGKNKNDFYFWKVHSGSEIDLFWQHGGQNYGIEFKYADAPKRTKSMTAVIENLSLAHLWIVYPGRTAYRIDRRITVQPLQEIPVQWAYPSTALECLNILQQATSSQALMIAIKIQTTH